MCINCHCPAGPPGIPGEVPPDNKPKNFLYKRKEPLVYNERKNLYNSYVNKILKKR